MQSLVLCLAFLVSVRPVPGGLSAAAKEQKPFHGESFYLTGTPFIGIYSYISNSNGVRVRQEKEAPAVRKRKTNYKTKNEEKKNKNKIKMYLFCGFSFLLYSSFCCLSISPLRCARFSYCTFFFYVTILIIPLVLSSDNKNGDRKKV